MLLCMSFGSSSSGPLAGRKAVVITASDRCFLGMRKDLSGPAVAEVLSQAGAEVKEILILPDELEALTKGLRSAAESVDLVVTTGGTGLAARDITPEATRAVCDRLVPGIPELMRKEGLDQTPLAVLSRGVCGVCGSALILNLPGSPRGAESSLRSVLHVLPHALELLAGQTEHTE